MLPDNKKYQSKTTTKPETSHMFCVLQEEASGDEFYCCSSQLCCTVESKEEKLCLQ